jgi:hypothetical protein
MKPASRLTCSLILLLIALLAEPSSPSQDSPEVKAHRGDLPSFSGQIPPFPPGAGKTPWWKIFIEIGTLVALVGAFIAAAIYAGIAARQLTSMRKTYDEIQKQTILQRQQIIGTFSAAIPKERPGPQTIPNDLQLLNYTGISLNFRNVGGVKAKSFVADATLIRRSLPDYNPIGVPQCRQVTKTEMRPYEQTGPQGIADAAHIRFDTDTFTERDLHMLQDLQEIVEIEGYFQYDNGFGDTVREPFCFVYATIPQHTFPSGAGTGGGTGGWYPCEDAKSVIAQALKWKQRP